MPRRLFLFAAYDPMGMVGEALLWQLSALKNHGDIVFFADCELQYSEIDKLSGMVLYAGACPHGEYDFGSYKRAWNWARENLALNEYDFLYLVNDSVFGPFEDMDESLSKMETLSVPAFALVLNPHRKHPHLQTWFAGFEKKVFTQAWFNEFLLSVQLEKSKEEVCRKYETGLTLSLQRHGIHYDALFKFSGKTIYNSPDTLFHYGLPFIKKSSFTRHNGSLGHKLKYVFDRLPSECREIILKDAARLYGSDYMDNLLTANPFRIAGRYIEYLYRKIF